MPPAAGPAVTHVGPDVLQQAILAGIAYVPTQRERINSINVCPVPDGDTGTNLDFTLGAVREALAPGDSASVDELLDATARAAIDGARGNSGAIMAQYFQGFLEGFRGRSGMDGAALAAAANSGARSAWSAMSRPVAGTLPTVLEDFATELQHRVEAGVGDLRRLLRYGLDRARRSLANTRQQLPQLRQAGVVDAGAQGFVDLLEGIWRYTANEVLVESTAIPGVQVQPQPPASVSGSRYCTECILRGSDLDALALRARLEHSQGESLVVAGSRETIRIHVHTDTPGDIFSVCREFGTVEQEKAEDLRGQVRLLNHGATVVVVTDSGADIPAGLVERFGIQVVPVRVILGGEDHMDGVTLKVADFYRRLAELSEPPRTSQPPPADFRRLFELLVDHGHEVVCVNIARALSGTIQAAETSAADYDGVRVLDSLNASAGQGLLAVAAARWAGAGADADTIEQRLAAAAEVTRSYAILDDMQHGVRGGRLPAWVAQGSELTGLRPVLATNAEGRLVPRGVLRARRDRVAAFGRWLRRRLRRGGEYEVIISHGDCRADAERLREQLVVGAHRVRFCELTETGPALGAHAGPRVLVVGVRDVTAVE